MIKNIFAFILIVILTQNIFTQKIKFDVDAPILSLKAGFHTADGHGYYSQFPAGFSIDGTAEMATGKGWYIALNYDVSFASDEVYLWYYNYKTQRSFVNYNFTPFVRYRYVIGRNAISLGLGIGSSVMVINDYYESKDKMISLNARLGFDYAINKNFVISAEGVYHGMSELDMGGGSSYEMYQFKIGMGYLFTQVDKK